MMALVVVAFFFLRQLWMVLRLIQWAACPLGTPTPSASGAWGAVFDALHKRGRLASAEREQATQELDRFRRAAEALPDGVMILDGHRAIEWMNLHAEACLGLKGSVDTGSRITHLLREPEFLEYLDSPDHRGVPLELHTQRNPGRSLQIQAAPFAAGRTLLLVRDVTQLQKLATMRRDFVANVSHELKTPLTVTLGFVETALEALQDTPPQEIAHYLHTAAEQARRMQQLIDDLLTLSSLETDSPPPLEDPVDIAALLADIRQEVEALSAGRHRITLENQGPRGLLGSARELRSAFANLAVNAVRYTPDGGDIVLRWSLEGTSSGRFSVRDSGIGIAAQHLPRLTERFYRVDRGRSREAGGTGLGLAIVKHVLERHQATLQVESELGRGSRFSAVFPPHRIQS
ncbi:MAG: phosphate regulon sensor histidine kinase PhoR [Rhodocyclales bacterium RIFCSPLOWO2_02_FULL_63_24]|nr:MAG: phosphate regulon sensor histidine kinase PhoR [Rhodocyclales bacterium GWA2_65_19]OHC72481.1 MAG: phosphate regulon sensor histidine kinase PhoR [Rhodocyclales bacterium RIFCSPLOWO2_02_FULL_63_24]